MMLSGQGTLRGILLGGIKYILGFFPKGEGAKLVRGMMEWVEWGGKGQNLAV